MPETTMSIKAPPQEEAEITIEGLSSLIVHRFSEKAKAAMAAKQTGRGPAVKEARNIEDEAWASAYEVPGREDWPNGKVGKYCFPASAFKHAFLHGVGLVGDKQRYPKSKATTWFYVLADPILKFQGYRIRTDPVRISSVMSLVHRLEFLGWEADLSVIYNSISTEELVTFLNLGGLGGVGEWRPTSPRNKSGSHGQFRVRELKKLSLKEDQRVKAS